MAHLFSECNCLKAIFLRSFHVRQHVLCENGTSGKGKMAQTPQQLFDFLTKLGIAFSTQEHEALFTVEQSSEIHRVMVGGHVKNLFVKDKKGKIFLLVALAHSTIDLKKIHEKIGASGRVSFVGAEVLMELLGVIPGSVTPFGAINDVEHRVSVILEAQLMAHAQVNVHPLVNTMTTAIASDDLLKFLRATGHEPQVIAFAESGDVATH